MTAVWGSAPILAVKPLTIEKNVVLTVLGSADKVTEGRTQGTGLAVSGAGIESQRNDAYSIRSEAVMVSGASPNG